MQPPRLTKSINKGNFEELDYVRDGGMGSAVDGDAPLKKKRGSRERREAELETGDTCNSAFSTSGVAPYGRSLP